MRLSTGRRNYKNSCFFRLRVFLKEQELPTDPSKTDQEESLPSILLLTDGPGCSCDEGTRFPVSFVA